MEHPLGAHNLQSLVVTIDRETTEINLQSKKNIQNDDFVSSLNLCKSAAGEFHNDGDVVPVVDCSNLGDHRVGRREHLDGEVSPGPSYEAHLSRVLPKDPGDEVDVVDCTVVEDPTADLQVIQRWQWRVPRGGLKT